MTAGIGRQLIDRHHKSFQGFDGRASDEGSSMPTRFYYVSSPPQFYIFFAIRYFSFRGKKADSYMQCRIISVLESRLLNFATFKGIVVYFLIRRCSVSCLIILCSDQQSLYYISTSKHHSAFISSFCTTWRILTFTLHFFIHDLDKITHCIWSFGLEHTYHPLYHWFFFVYGYIIYFYTKYLLLLSFHAELCFVLQFL